ncbi:hypothetical protein MFLAVUS_010605 [Mucor flavus]|uniref:C2H2-type domain-containing protein n=1 Tax=Mucor flavus TaxID=439312 RepID=A0ABP9ZD66_9FUNG
MSDSSKRRKVEYSCQYCDKSYKKPSRLAEHERTHTGERPFKCTHVDCDKAYFRSSHLTAHERTHSNIKDFCCSFDDCTVAFSTKQHLLRHEKIHTSPVIKCEFPGCNAEFTKRFQLRWHKASHEKSAHPCSVCQTVFDSLPALEKHKDRVHENPVTYNCSICQNIFAKWTELRKHVQTDHPIQCTLCKRVYSKTFNLKQHIKEKHIEQEIIPCDWPGCESVLQTKRSFKMHVALVHEQDTRFKCEICNKGFPYKSILDRHKESHTPKSKSASPRPKKSIIEQLTGFNHYTKNEKFECPFPQCLFKFTNSHLLRRHIEGKKHAEDVKSFEQSRVTPH